MVLLDQPLFEQRGAVLFVQQHEDVGTNPVVADPVAGRPLHDVADVGQAHLGQEQVKGELGAQNLATRRGRLHVLRKTIKVENQELRAVCTVGGASARFAHEGPDQRAFEQAVAFACMPDQLAMQVRQGVDDLMVRCELPRHGVGSLGELRAFLGV